MYFGVWIILVFSLACGLDLAFNNYLFSFNSVGLEVSTVVSGYRVW